MYIQIVEDDKALSDGITMTLQQQNTEFVQSDTIKQAKTDFLEYEIELIILDINLPDGSGYEYLKWIRQKSNLPVLILTANDMEMDEVMGLNLGADDYMTKPFSLAVLRARIQALLRRGNNRGSVYIEDKFCFDFERQQFQIGEQKIIFSPNEQKLLKLFIENRGILLTREVMIERIWSVDGEFVDENALSVTVNRLRSKLENKKEGVSFIQTIYGQGYMWKKKEQGE